MSERLIRLLEPCVNALGYDLIDVDSRTGGPGGGLIRVYIDGPDGVTLDDCAAVSEQVSGVLDVEDPMSGNYTLEISSPGEDRILRTRAHFEQFTGQRIKALLRQPRDGRRKFTGTLLALEDEEVVVVVDGEKLRLPFADIEKARLAP